MAGDQINMRGGVYDRLQIAPANSGTRNNPIVYQAYAGEQPTIRGDVVAIFLFKNEWIKVDGIRAHDVRSFFWIRNHSHFNEIVRCDFDTAQGGAWINGGSGGSQTNYSTNNWIHHNEMRRVGRVETSPCNDGGFVLTVGIANSDFYSRNNTIEHNHMYYGGHHIVQLNTENNVFRNNVLHNEAWMEDPGGCLPSDEGKFGNRNMSVLNGDPDRLGVYNLIERNRFGHAGVPPDDNEAANLTLISQRNIVRYNLMYHASGDGLYFKALAGNHRGSDNRVYHNTIHQNGIGPEFRTDLRRYGVRFHGSALDNILKNNIIYGSVDQDIACLSGDCSLNSIVNNWFGTAPALRIAEKIGSYEVGDPLFVDPALSSPFNLNRPNLSLSDSSPAINGAAPLTRALGGAMESRTLKVEDALFFQDGSWGSELSQIEADWVAVGATDNVSQITSISYSTNTITLATPITWSDNAPIWIYRISNGERILFGAGPDFGAMQLTSASAAPNPAAPSNLRIGSE